MKERIKKFMDHKSVSPGDLASATGVQRSNISHILNGRNKPGAAFIEKFLLSYPEINARWFLTGEGEMINNTEDIQGDDKNSIIFDNPATKPKSKSAFTVKSEPEAHYGNKPGKIVSGGQVEKIVLLYTDGTFAIYDPNKGI